jgi:hypothetical protein
MALVSGSIPPPWAFRIRVYLLAPALWRNAFTA